MLSMPAIDYFRTGDHHVLCEIPSLNNKSDIQREFEDSWDQDHVRLACSSRISTERPLEGDLDHQSHHHVSAQEVSTWPAIVQGLTTPIHTTQDLAAVMTQWSERDPTSWNTNALEDFLDWRTKAGVAGSVPDDTNMTPPRTVSPADMCISEDEKSANEREYFHTHVLKDVQFLSPAERDRFFNVLLPKIQELALRLPELMRRPIPFLKQQQDSAITLSQEQIACLLANAFFCTFPCRNIPNRSIRNRSSERRKRPSDDVFEANRPSGSKSKTTSTIRTFGAHSCNGRALDKAPKDLYGAATKYARGNRVERINEEEVITKPYPGRPTDSFGNAQGQLSLFAYFNKQEPAASSYEKISPRSSFAEEYRNCQERQNTCTSESESKSCRKDERGGKDKRSRTAFSPYPSINFSSLFHSEERSCSSTIAAKLRCLLHYFDRVTTSMPDGAVTFHRQVLKSPVTLNATERGVSGTFQYANVRVDIDNPLEDDAPLGALQLDFANKVIGGGVLGRGAVQEEIRFAICPELIISRLFTQQLQDNEALLIKGAERYSNYNGYARTFEWHSDHVDETPRDKLGRRQTEICVIDALPFKSKEQQLEQFKEEHLMREINKALVGFRPSPITNSEWGMLRPETEGAQEERSSRPPGASLIATGNWGCGAFGGHLQLKFLIQWIAASICESYTNDGPTSKNMKNQIKSMGRGLIYYTYGLDELGYEIENFVNTIMLTEKRFYEPERIIEMILQYPMKSSQGRIIGLPERKSLFEHIGKALGLVPSDGSLLPP